MRPRFANRGSYHVHSAGRHDQGDASMRPRFANRGSFRIHSHDDSWMDRFNEAPIRESGKLWQIQFRMMTTITFNEAPIRESGKFA